MNKGDLVYLQWTDTIACPVGWQPIADIGPTELAIIESVGWVMDVTEDAVLIAPHIASQSGKDTDIMGHITVPRSAIIRTTKIKLVHYG